MKFIFVKPHGHSVIYVCVLNFYLMGNDIAAFRMTVGLFNSSKYCCRKKVVYMWSASNEFVLFLLTLFGLSRALLSGCIIRPFVFEMNLLLIDALRFLLLLSGDIELNPGPDYKALSVLHLNVRSIRNKLDYVASNLCNFDILCFTETHLTGVFPIML